ncbi:MAG TPA: hypothetical protein PKE40_03190 [Arachnia sp.]|nr:hypothetical protein [Arachnia sp.]HMT85335.1 hypothetical protein [Arachnia sp.]
MSSPFEPQAQGDYWFRIGRLHVTTTLLVVLAGVAGMLACTFSGALASALVFVPAQVFRGELWRIFTWPLADVASIWSLLTFLMLWYFGTMLERDLGRNQMMRLFVTIWGVLTVVTGIFGLFLPSGLAGLGQIQFLILLLWIAEYPRARFLFNIPAWAFGAFLLALQVLQTLAAGAWGSLLSLAVSLLFVAIGARRVGLLSAYDWIPASPRPPRGSGQAASPGFTVSSGPSRQERRRANDEERLDQLLAKISAEGLHSLSKRERRELEELRLRRRRA